MNTTCESSAMEKQPVDLAGVPETLLWPLWNRAAEQAREDRLIEDPMSAELVGRIDYDFEASFGKPHVSHAIRARVADDSIRGWLDKNPACTVISLGEGLDSQFWRVDNGTVNWLSVDVPEAVAVRNRLLPANERINVFASSALDPDWMDAAPPNEPVFITMAGLLMYFEEQQVMDLLRRVATRFPSGSEVFFDAIPQWFSRKTVRGLQMTPTYKVPPAPWGLNYGEFARLLTVHPAIKLKQRMTYADPFPKRLPFYHLLSKVPGIANRLAPWMAHLEIVK